MRLGVVADVHWDVRATTVAAWHNPYDFAGLEERLQAAAAWFAQADVAAVAVLGDLGHWGEPEELRRPLEVLAGAGRPLLVVPGNHDLAGDPGALAAAARREGVRLAPFAHDLGGHLALGVALRSDDLGLTARGLLPAAPAPSPVPLVLSHYPLLSQAAALAAEGFAYPGDLLDREELCAALGPALVLHGHTHARLVARRGPLLQLGFAALVEHPAEAAVVEVDGHGHELEVRREVRSLALLPHVRTPVLGTERTWRFDGEAWRAAV